MTLAELQQLVSTIRTEGTELVNAGSDFNAFIENVNTIVNGDFAGTIFSTQQVIDNFISAETPIYLAKLNRIKLAAQALGITIP